MIKMIYFLSNNHINKKLPIHISRIDDNWLWSMNSKVIALNNQVSCRCWGVHLLNNEFYLASAAVAIVLCLNKYLLQNSHVFLLAPILDENPSTCQARRHELMWEQTRPAMASIRLPYNKLACHEIIPQREETITLGPRYLIVVQIHHKANTHG